MSTPEPSWCQPDPAEALQVPRRTAQERGLSYTAICSLGWQPIAITGLCRDLLVRHFSSSDLLEAADLRRSVWSPGERTGILIETITKWMGTLAEKRPAVIIKPNARRNLRMAIGDRRTGTDERGMQRYETFWIGSHTLFCIQGSGAGADILATEVQREMTQFGPEIVRDLGLLRWAVTEVGAIAEVEESRESFVIPVTLGWAYQEQWTLDQETPKLKKIPLSVLLHGSVANQTS